ncbi:MAG: FAD-dependent oxidoreductase [Bacteroidota bacterium]
MNNAVSIWEKQSFLKADVIIVGAGISGLSTAASLKEKDPSLSIIILEKGILPSGASTKNAGFACFGSLSELENDVGELGEEGTVVLVEQRFEGLEKTSARLGRAVIDLQLKGGYELIFHKDSTEHRIARMNELLKPLFQEDVFASASDELKKFGFGNTQQLVKNKYEGQLDTGKLMSALWHYVSELGVRILTGADVEQVEEDHHTIRVRAADQWFTTNKLAYCTNAFTQDVSDAPLDIRPGRGMVMSVQTEIELPFEGTFHYDQGYFYFRDYNRSLLFGGGRNEDFSKEETSAFGINQKIRDRLLHDLKTIILPGQQFEIAAEWSGIMAFGKNKSPIIQSIKPNVYVGVRLGGMGVAIGSLVGEELADLIVSN